MCVSFDTDCIVQETEASSKGFDFNDSSANNHESSIKQMTCIDKNFTGHVLYCLGELLESQLMTFLAMLQTPLQSVLRGRAGSMLLSCHLVAQVAISISHFWNSFRWYQFFYIYLK